MSFVFCPRALLPMPYALCPMLPRYALCPIALMCTYAPLYPHSIYPIPYTLHLHPTLPPHTHTPHTHTHTPHTHTPHTHTHTHTPTPTHTHTHAVHDSLPEGALRCTDGGQGDTGSIRAHQPWCDIQGNYACMYRYIGVIVGMIVVVV
jgi:hypothetical protein